MQIDHESLASQRDAAVRGWLAQMAQVQALAEERDQLVQEYDHRINAVMAAAEVMSRWITATDAMLAAEGYVVPAAEAFTEQAEPVAALGDGEPQPEGQDDGEHLRGAPAVQRVLQEAGRPLTVPEVVERMVGRGWVDSEGDNVGDAVRVAIRRAAKKYAPNIVKVKRGVWEWRPQAELAVASG